VAVHRNQKYHFGWSDPRVGVNNVIRTIYLRTRCVITNDMYIGEFHNDDAHGVKNGNKQSGHTEGNITCA
jgi:hypothetical protein